MKKGDSLSVTAVENGYLVEYFYGEEIMSMFRYVAKDEEELLLLLKEKSFNRDDAVKGQDP